MSTAAAAQQGAAADVAQRVPIGACSILASTLGASAIVGGLCHAAERPIRWAAPAKDPMTLFEHLSVAISLITSFIIVRLLEGLGYASSPSSGRKRYTPFTLWLAVFLIGSAIVWWAIWSFEHVEWNLLSFLLILALPCSGFMVAAVAVPSSPDTVTDWREHFFRVRGRLFSFAILIQIVYSSCTYLLLDLPLFSPRRAWAIVNVSLYALAARTNSDGLQTILPCVYLLVFLVGGIFFYLEPGSAGAR